jgi:hypothetical protein
MPSLTLVFVSRQSDLASRLCWWGPYLGEEGFTFSTRLPSVILPFFPSLPADTFVRF